MSMTRYIIEAVLILAQVQKFFRPRDRSPFCGSSRCQARNFMKVDFAGAAPGRSGHNSDPQRKASRTFSKRTLRP